MKNLPLLLIAFVTFTTGCKKHKTEPPVSISPDYDKGISFLNKEKDSAYHYFNKATSSSKDSLYIAMAYNRIAVLELEAGDYYSSQETVLTSLKYLNEDTDRDHACLSSNYNVIGNDALNLKDYTQAIKYYDLAMKFNDFPQYQPTYLNNKALAFQKMYDYDKAIAIYQSIEEESKGDSTAYARVLSNLARTKWLKNPDYNAVPEFFKALEIRKKKSDQWGLNASYAHLSDYYSGSRPDSALFYAKKMFDIAQNLNSPDDKLEALQKIIKINASNDLKNYFTVYMALNDSVQFSRITAKNQLAVIKYETEKNKADNLLLQQDNARKQLRIVYQRIAFWGAIIIFTVAAIMAINWYSKRKRKMEWESRNLIRENQLKTSKKVHDVVANGLYRIMNDLEHREIIEKEKLLDKIESLYEQSRDISYEKPPVKTEGFSETIHSLLTSFASDSIRILITGNHEELWSAIPTPIKKELDYVLQELMVNMKKHSRAQNVVIKFERNSDNLKIHYKDDGIGFSSGIQYGNGMRNTENRINSINGQIIFDGNHGLEVKISIPIASQND